MKLYRIQTKNNGMGFFNTILRQEYIRITNGYFKNKLREMEKDLYAPKLIDYFVVQTKAELPRHAVYYFKEKFWKRYAELFDNIQCSHIPNLEIVELESEFLDYVTHYEDEDQICLELRDNSEKVVKKRWRFLPWKE